MEEIKTQGKNDYDTRIQGEVYKFCLKNDIDKATMLTFTDWMERFIRQDERKRISNLINYYN